MEDEKVRFMSAWLTHMVRSTHLPPPVLKDILEGKTPGSKGYSGVQMDDNLVFNLAEQDPEKQIKAFKDIMTLFYNHMAVSYDENIANRHLLSPAKEFIDRNKQKVDALGLGGHIAVHIEYIKSAPKLEGLIANILSGGQTVSSGVPGFDELEWHGVPKASSILVQSTGWKELDRFANQFMKQGIDEGSPVLAILAGRSPDEFKRAMKALGAAANVVDEDDHLWIIDWHSCRTQRVDGIDELGFTIKVSKDLTNVRIAVNKVLRLMPTTGARRALVEILSPAITGHSLEMVIDFVKVTKEKFKGAGITALFLIRTDAHTPDALASLQIEFDGVIEIGRFRTVKGDMSSVALLAGAGAKLEGKQHPMMLDRKGLISVDAKGAMPPITSFLEPEKMQVAPPPSPPPPSPPSQQPATPAPPQKQATSAPSPPPPTPPSSPSKSSFTLPPLPSFGRTEPSKPSSEGTSAGDILKRLRSTPITEPSKEPSKTRDKEKEKEKETDKDRDKEKEKDKEKDKKKKKKKGEAEKGGEDISALFIEATQLQKNGRRLEAIALFDRILAARPNEREAITKKAVLLQIEGRHAEAVDCYDKALDMNEEDAESWSNKGISLRAVGKLKEAVEAYDHALRIEPKDAGVWSNRGIALRSLGKNDEAVESYDKALEVNPKDASVWSNRGVLLTVMRRHQDALHSFDQALKADPNYEKARKNRAILLEKMKG